MLACSIFLVFVFISLLFITIFYCVFWVLCFDLCTSPIWSSFIHSTCLWYLNNRKLMFFCYFSMVSSTYLSYDNAILISFCVFGILRIPNVFKRLYKLISLTFLLFLLVFISVMFYFLYVTCCGILYGNCKAQKWTPQYCVSEIS